MPDAVESLISEARPSLGIVLNPRIGIGLIFVGQALIVLAKDQKADPVIELPSYVVNATKDLHEIEHWRYCKVGFQEVLSEADEAVTRDYIQRLIAMPVIVSAIYPMPESAGIPSTTILTTSQTKLEGFAPAELIEKANGTEVSNFYLKNAASEIYVLKYDSYRSIFNVDVFRQLERRYVEQRLNLILPRRPPWFIRGMDEIISDPWSWIDGDSIEVEVGKINRNSGSHPVRFNSFFATGYPHPMFPSVRDIITGKLSSLKVYDRMSCWAFIQCAMNFQSGLYKERFLKFLDYQTAHPDCDAAAKFTEIMKKDPERFSVILSWYIEKIEATDGHTLHLKSPARDIEIVDADATTIGRIKGDAFRRSGHIEEAKEEYANAYRREKLENKDHDTALLASMGLLQLGLGENGLAEPLLQFAADHEVKDPEIYLALYKLRLARVGDAPLTVPLMVYLMDPLMTVRKICPPEANVYRLLAEVCTKSTIKIDKNVLEILDEGPKFFPGDAHLLLRTAQAFAKNGMEKKAKALAASGKAANNDPALRVEFDALLGS